MCWPKPSTTRLKPIISRNPRHRITTVGCLETKAISGLEAIIITAIAIHTAAIITARLLTMPTAVMTLSSENTASRTTIWTITCQNTAWTTLPLLWPCAPSSRSCSSIVPLNSRNTPPMIRIRSRPEKEKPPSENSGLVSVTIQEIENSSAMRMNSASDRPMRRALLRWFAGSLSARMAMNTRLSIPSTTSSSTRVTSPIQIFGSARNSMSNLS